MWRRRFAGNQYGAIFSCRPLFLPVQKLLGVKVASYLSDAPTGRVLIFVFFSLLHVYANYRYMSSIHLLPLGFKLVSSSFCGPWTPGLVCRVSVGSKVVTGALVSNEKWGSQ